MAVLLLSRHCRAVKYLINESKCIFLKESSTNYQYLKSLSICELKHCQHIQSRSISSLKFLRSAQKTDVSVSSEEKEELVPKDKSEIAPILEVEEDDIYKERYIPITRQSMIRLLVEERSFLSDSEKKIFTDFATLLDTAIINKYHRILQDIKVLFDPINPDKDTISTRKWNRREKLDNEFWLLQRLEDIAEKANFHELSESTISKALEEHDVSEGVRVRVNRSNFDILRIWALGKEKPTVSAPWYNKLLFWKRSAPQVHHPAFYKRVIVALRLKKDQKLMLKVYKEVPANNLEMLIPDGKIMIKKRDKQIIAVSGFLALSTVLAKCVTILAHLNVDWVLSIFIVAGLVGGRTYTVYNNRRNAYLARLNRQLYFKNVANNRGSLALLVDRAEDESFKEALLTYTFLLTNRSPLVRMRDSPNKLPQDLGNITDLHLERKVEEWVEMKTKTNIEFDSSEAIKHLQDFGILSISNGKLNVLPLDAAMRNLPQQPTLRVERMEEDLLEGYDRDYFLETEEKYKEEEEKDSRYGWF